MEYLKNYLDFLIANREAIFEIGLAIVVIINMHEIKKLKADKDRNGQ